MTPPDQAARIAAPRAPALAGAPGWTRPPVDAAPAGAAAAAPAVARKPGAGAPPAAAVAAGVAARTATAGKRRGRGEAAPLPPALLALCVALLDAASVTASGAFLSGLSVTLWRPEPTLILFAAVLLPCLAGLGGGYALDLLFRARRSAAAGTAAVAAGMAGLWLAAHALGAQGQLPAGIAGLWLILGGAVAAGLRAGGAVLLRLAPPARVRRRTVLVGDDRLAGRVAAGLGGPGPGREFMLVGLVEDLPGDEDGPAGGTLPRLGGPDALPDLIRRGRIDQVVLAVPPAAQGRIARLMRLLRIEPVEVHLATVPTLPDGAAAAAAAADPRGAGRGRGGPVLTRLQEPPMRGLGGVLKLVSDYALAVAALAICAVPMALIALAIRLDSPGPVLFRQRRTGYANRDFHVLKFRTLYHEATCQDASRQVTADDPRVTRVGAVLRRTSLDELPQIFNVLRGEMSVVGPRPHAPGTRAGGRPFEEVDARYAARHRVKPGLTGLAQVRGWRGPTETEEKLLRRVDSDLEYIERWSLWLDLAILARTLLAVVRMRNAC